MLSLSLSISRNASPLLLVLVATVVASWKSHLPVSALGTPKKFCNFEWYSISFYLLPDLVDPPGISKAVIFTCRGLFEDAKAMSHDLEICRQMARNLEMARHYVAITWFNRQGCAPPPPPFLKSSAICVYIYMSLSLYLSLSVSFCLVRVCLSVCPLLAFLSCLFVLLSSCKFTWFPLRPRSLAPQKGASALSSISIYRSICIDCGQTCSLRALNSNCRYRIALPEEWISITETDLWEWWQKSSLYTQILHWIPSNFHYRYRLRVWNN